VQFTRAEFTNRLKAADIRISWDGRGRALDTMYGGSRKDAGQAIGQVGDGGIDGIIKEDKLGLVVSPK
jgi:restriction system protein